jgi:Arc/MetJ-type ribon-helix-helix transcriptional regulator
MVRTQIQLTEEQARRLRRVAEREGISMAEVIRRSLERVLDDEEADLARRYRQALDWAGRLTDEPDLAENHDEYLVEAYGSSRR